MTARSLVFLAILMLAASRSAAEPDRVADAVYLDGKVITLDEKERMVEALAVGGGRIVAAGTTAEVRKWIGDKTKVVQLEGKMVLPGLCESHCHALGVARSALTQPYVDLTSIAEVQDWLRKRAKEVPAGRWLEVPRTEITRLKERRHPTPTELDAACTTHPVLYTSARKHALNSRGFAELKLIDKHSKVPDGDVIRDEDGKPLLLRGGDALIRQAMPPPEHTQAETLASLVKVLGRYNEVGITSIFERATDPAGLATFRELHQRGKLPVRVTGTFRFSARTEEAVDKYIKSLKVRPGEGDDWVRAGALKITVDGGIHWGNTRLSEPYGERRARFYRLSDPEYRGDLYYTPEQMKTIFQTVNRAGWQMSAHVTGDAGIEQVLDAIEAVAEKEPTIRDRRFTLIHAYFPSVAIAKRAKRLGVFVDTQCYLYYRDSDALAEVYGKAWAERFIGLADWTREGVRVAINSDHMIGLDPDHAMNSFNPFLTMYVAVSRRNLAGVVYGPEQKVSRVDALRAMTTWAAHLGMNETRAGALEPGKYADFVVIDRDYLKCPEKEIRDIKVVRTIVGGKSVFERN